MGRQGTIWSRMPTYTVARLAFWRKGDMGIPGRFGSPRRVPLLLPPRACLRLRWRTEASTVGAQLRLRRALPCPWSEGGRSPTARNSFCRVPMAQNFSVIEDDGLRSLGSLFTMDRRSASDTPAFIFQREQFPYLIQNARFEHESLFYFSQGLR